MKTNDYMNELDEIEFTVVRDIHDRALYVMWDENGFDNSTLAESGVFHWRTSQDDTWHATGDEDEMVLVIDAFIEGTLFRGEEGE